MSEVGRVHFNWMSHVDGDWLEQPCEITDEDLARAVLVVVADDAPICRVVAFCQLVARL